MKAHARTRYTFRRVVVGMDFSAPALAAAQWVVRSLGPGTAVRLVHVIDVPQPARKTVELLTLRVKLIAKMRREATRRLAEVREALDTSRVRGKIRTGSVAGELARTARDWKADLIVVGQPEGTPARARRQSVARALLLDAGTAVLAVRGKSSEPPRRVLAAVDDSPRAKAVVAAAGRFALRWNVPVTVLSVIPASLVGMASIGARAPELRRAEARLQRAAAARVDRQVRVLRARGAQAEGLCVTGDPQHVIASVARRLGADLVVVGLRKPGRLERALFGVVAHQVLGLGDSSVLVATAAGK